MAFAALVYQGQRQLDDCPHLDAETSKKLNQQMATQNAPDFTGEEALEKYQKRFSNIDFSGRAEVLGGWMNDSRLTFHCLKKIFEVDSQGGLHSECHQNPWLHVPMLSYILDSKGITPAGDWVRFFELKTAKPWINFFEYSLETPIRQLGERDPQMLLDILELFAEKEKVTGFATKVTFLLRPLPKVPFLFGYQPAEEGLPADFTVFLDRTAEVNLDAESLFRLGRGMAEMFKKIAMRHGYA
jgi:hypothetical protein